MTGALDRPELWTDRSFGPTGIVATQTLGSLSCRCALFVSSICKLYSSSTKSTVQRRPALAAPTWSTDRIA